MGSNDLLLKMTYITQKPELLSKEGLHTR